ncbi:hypothetical protein KI387_022630, partial [Taxus chinensis]
KLLEFAVNNLEASRQEISFLQQEKEILSQNLKLQQSLWDADHQHSQQCLQTKELMCKEKELTHAYEIAKKNLIHGTNQKDTLLLKLRLDSALDDLEELQSQYEFLMLELKEEQAKDRALIKDLLEKEKEPIIDQSQIILEMEQRTQRLQESLLNKEKDHRNEIAKVKSEHKTINNLRKNEVSALVRERDFVWNQLKRIEEDYADRVKCKNEQLQVAYENIEKLRLAMDELQKANDEKNVELTIMKVEFQEKEGEGPILKENLQKNSKCMLQEPMPTVKILPKSKGSGLKVLSVDDTCDAEKSKESSELNRVYQTCSQEINTKPQTLNQKDIICLESIQNNKVPVEDSAPLSNRICRSLNNELYEHAVGSDFVMQPPANEPVSNESPYVDNNKAADGMDLMIIKYPPGRHEKLELKCDGDCSFKDSNSTREIIRSSSSNKRRWGADKLISLVKSSSKSASWDKRNLKPRGEYSDEFRQPFGQIVKYNENLHPVRANFFPSSFSIPKVK